MKFNELILKVTSCCNLNCKYCYVFNQGDFSYKTEPAVIDEKLTPIILNAIKEHCEKHGINTFLIIFHGGEPLMAPKDFFRNFVNMAKSKLENIELLYGVQTNGTLLTQDWIDVFNELNISIGISVDGPEEASSNRVYRSNNKCAYNGIMRGISLLEKNNMPIDLLSVINIHTDPTTLYSYYKKIKADYLDILFPDVTYENKKETGIGKWLCELFDLWYEDNESTKPIIRYFDSIVGLLLGIERGYEVLGAKLNKTISIKPNGNIELVDNLKICGNGFTNTGLNIKSCSFDDVEKNAVMQLYYSSHTDKVLCKKCRDCTIKNICGGGNLAHRYSTVNQFDNPSAYCHDIYMLCAHIQKRLFEDLPDIFNENNVIKLF